MKTFFYNKKNIALIILGILSICLHLFSTNKGLVEQYYSNGLYPLIGSALRRLTGRLPISIGDVLYTIFGLFLVIRLFRFFKKVFKKQLTKQYAKASIYTILFWFFFVYFLFNALWGLNYNRLGISSQLHLNPTSDYSTQALDSLTQTLIHKTNENRLALGEKIKYPNTTTIFNEAVQAYHNIEKKYPFLHYQNPSIKVPVYNTLGSYLGYSGYYNPFTGEAQVNTVLPKFVLPYVTCHEMAHQLGYATEDEANFTGYLAATQSEDVLFKYSTYLDLYRYANNELWFRDSSLAKENYAKLDTLVKTDLQYLRKYLLAHENPVERGTTYLYSEFLKANQQPQGIDTYNIVTAWLIAYQKKYKIL
ncbi:DUF3810 domain-containing protein [Arachidicoccus sp.]|uniref:DUF3810 domain-containing protein n=1 Tax=Arachidicoccus sp. TaxID=1872624 RepID=UPI003D2625C8